MILPFTSQNTFNNFGTIIFRSSIVWRDHRTTPSAINQSGFSTKLPTGNSLSCERTTINIENSWSVVDIWVVTIAENREKMKYFASFLALSLIATSLCAESDVLDLGDSDFSTRVAQTETTLVMFYAPWCEYFRRQTRDKRSYLTFVLFSVHRWPLQKGESTPDCRHNYRVSNKIASSIV